MTRPQLIDDNDALHCDWRVNTTDCVDAPLFKGLWCFVLACVVLISVQAWTVLLYKVAVGKFHLFERNTLFVRAKEGMTLSAAVFGVMFIPICVLQIFDVPTSQAAREALFLYPHAPMWAMSVFFLSAIVRSLPERYWHGDDEQSSSTRLPAAWFFRTSIGPVCLISLNVIGCTLGVGAGIARDNGNIAADVILYMITFNLNVALTVFEILWTGYMAWKFSRIMSTLLLESTKLDKETVRKERIALSRAKRIFIALLVAHMVAGLGCLLVADVYYVYQNTALSVATFLIMEISLMLVMLASMTIDFIGFFAYACCRRASVHATASTSNDSPMPSQSLSHNKSDEKLPDAAAVNSATELA